MTARQGQPLTRDCVGHGRQMFGSGPVTANTGYYLGNSAELMPSSAVPCTPVVNILRADLQLLESSTKLPFGSFMFFPQTDEKPGCHILMGMST